MATTINIMTSNVGFDLDGIIAPEPKIIDKLFKNCGDIHGADLGVFIRDYLLPKLYEPWGINGTIITRRPQFDSESTIFWLKKNGIKYSKIIFAPKLLTDEENWNFKANHIIEEKIEYYLESDAVTAEKIEKVIAEKVRKRTTKPNIKISADIQLFLKMCWLKDPYIGI